MTNSFDLSCGQEKISEEDLPQTFTVKLLGRGEARGLWGIKNTRDPVDNLIASAKDGNLSLPIVQLKVSKEGVHISPLRSKRKSQITPAPAQENCCTDQNANEISHKLIFKKTTQKTSIFAPLKLLGYKYKNSKNNDAHNKSVIISKSIENENDVCKGKSENTEKKKLETNFVLLENLKKESGNWNDRTFLGIDTISYGVQDLVFTRVFSMIVVSDEKSKIPFHCYAFICEDRHIARSITYSLAAAFQIYSRTIKASRPIVQLSKETVRKPKILTIDLKSPDEKRAATYSEA